MFYFPTGDNPPRLYYDRSMSRIINDHWGSPMKVRLLTDVSDTGVPLGWDGECVDNPDSRCSECVLTVKDGKNVLTWNRTAMGTYEYNVYVLPYSLRTIYSLM